MGSTGMWIVDLESETSLVAIEEAIATGRPLVLVGAAIGAVRPVVEAAVRAGAIILRKPLSVAGLLAAISSRGLGLENGSGALEPRVHEAS
jgi:hypothetical protein